jgi:hypothetical protein
VALARSEMQRRQAQGIPRVGAGTARQKKGGGLGGGGMGLVEIFFFFLSKTNNGGTYSKTGNESGKGTIFN